MISTARQTEQVDNAPRNTNRVEGGAIWVSLLKKVKPVTINRVVA
jgi:hypothetical protein